ncbi:biotin--[acetyl-CoA-carboxylase] ligase [Trinickia violacea]|uniref:biotin--[biotin carboxyl-carrier protein] ligase n=1 Tax=Trinickia violacea TaxID=2571746 RepID=A0A4P8IHE1_9BURK|nr:biotin--[acetyl-CoA-carboxylase] ligase [Trinickia violacea]QCP48058.1 biotin--[acetyl-CoA-carboxylase] ligase [Trinickia violacea]
MNDTHSLFASSGASAGTSGAWRIDRERAAERFVPAVHNWTIEIVDETGSTNADLMAELKSLSRDALALRSPAVRVAYRQTAGRGRQGRPWFGEPGNALMLSLGCVLPQPLEGLAGLSLAVGTALVEGLRTLPLEGDGNGETKVALKWPNDILLDGGKLAGILIETAWSTPGASAVVIGAGINVQGAEALAAQVDALQSGVAAQARATQPAALSQAWPGANLTDTFVAALNALDGALAQFSSEGFAPFAERWSAYHAYAGREVVLLEQGAEVARGIALGVDALGQLLLDTADGVRPIATGDVSLRLAENA